MRCSSPLLVKNRFGALVNAPCGQCTNCRLNYARQWSIRLTHEQSYYGENCCVITLTYDNKFLPANGSLCKEDFQKFMKRLRKHCGSNSIRYFCAGEYGGKFGRAHMHCILFGIPVDSEVFRNRHIHYEDGKPCGWHADMDAWRDPDTNEYIGKVHIAPFSKELSFYVTGYILKKVKGKFAKEFYSEFGIIPEFVLMSRKPGIGERYVRTHSDYYRTHQYVTQGRSKYPLPRYYLDKAGVKSRALEAMKREKERWEEFKSKYERQGMSILEISNLYNERLDQIELNSRARLKMKGNRNEN